MKIKQSRGFFGKLIGLVKKLVLLLVKNVLLSLISTAAASAADHDCFITKILKMDCSKQTETS